MNQLSNPAFAGRLIHVPLDRLNPEANGVRKTNGVSVDDLAASILAEGLLQNLTVYAAVPMGAGGSGEFDYLVCAGTRRLKALRKLVDEGKVPRDYEVPCLLIDRAQALTASLAENAIRVNMHPHDEFVAFAAMIDKGDSVDDIAARYGVTPHVVQQRLKLARVSPKLLEQFRQDKVSLAQMRALAISDDHAAQEKAWGKSKDEWNRAPERLRAALTHGEVDASRDPVAKFVGVAEYERAGGHVHRDLFGEPGSGYLTDRRLLEELATKKFAAIADRVRKEGWSDVQVRETLQDYGGELSEYSRANPDGHRKPDDAEKKRVAELTKERAQAEKRLNQLDVVLRESDALDADQQNEADRLQDRVDAIAAEIEDMEQARTKWDPSILAKGIAFVGLDPHSGVLKIYRGMVKGKLRQAKEKASGKNASKAEKSKLGHSDALMRELSTAVSYALAAEFIAHPDVALIALTHKLALAEFYTNGTHNHPVKIGRDREWANPLTNVDAVIAENPDIARIESERASLEKLLPKKSTELFAWLITDAEPGAAHTWVRVLGYCVADSLNAVSGIADDRADALAAALNLDMSTRWTARPANYLTRVSAAQIHEALKEVGADKATRDKAATLKKGELIALAQPLLSNWLPKPLRIGAQA